MPKRKWADRFQVGLVDQRWWSGSLVEWEGSLLVRRWQGVRGTGAAVMLIWCPAPSAFFFLLSLLYWPRHFFSSPSFGASSVLTSSCCCLTGPASGALEGMLELMLDHCNGTVDGVLCDDVEIRKEVDLGHDESNLLWCEI